MQVDKIPVLAAISVLAGSLPLAAFGLGLSYGGLIAGISTISFIFIFKKLEREILATGARTQVKAAKDLIETFSLFAIITAGLIPSIIPAKLALVTIAFMGMAKVYQRQLSSRFRQSYEFKIGENIWLTVAGLTYVLSTLHQNYLFYGMFILALMVLYDFVELLRRVERNH